jgi:hypothetical protein
LRSTIEKNGMNENIVKLTWWNGLHDLVGSVSVIHLQGQ